MKTAIRRDSIRSEDRVYFIKQDITKGAQEKARAAKL